LGEAPYQRRKVYNYSYDKTTGKLRVSHGLVIVYTLTRRVYEGPNEVKKRMYGYAVLGPGNSYVSPLIKNPPAYLFGHHREYQTAEKRDDVLNELWPHEGWPDAAQLQALLEKCRKE